MSGQGTKILASDYNAIQAKVALLLGSGSGLYGYGQTVSSSSVGTNSKISAAQWHNLRTDLLRTRQHQTGTDLTGTIVDTYINVPVTASTSGTNLYTVSTDTTKLSAGQQIVFSGATAFGGVTLGTTYFVTLVASSTQFKISATLGGPDFVLTTATGTMTGTVPSTAGILVTEADRATYNAMADLATTNYLATPPTTQATRENLVANQVRTAGWNGNLTQTVTINFPDANSARYYFNTGSRIEFSSTLENFTVNPKNVSWNTILTNMGVINFNYNSTTCTGSGITSSIGWYQLTTSDQLIFEKDVSSSTYVPNRFQINARRNAGSTSVIFTIQWMDANNPGGFRVDENVTGTLTSYVQVYRASGANVSVPNPPAVTTTIG
jgi:hypothetical protein